MIRSLLSLSLAVALAFAGTVAFDLSRGVPAAEAAQKVCKARTPAGKIKTWRCAANQACCTNKSMNMYVCGFPGLGCL